MWYKLSVMFCLLLMSLAVAARDGDNVVYLKKSPLVNGYTILPIHDLKLVEKGTYLPNHGIDIYSDSNSVFSLSSGSVSACISVGDDFKLMVKSHDTFFVYGHLNEVSFKKGDTVLKQMKVGTISRAEDNPGYEVNFQMWLLRKKGKVKEIEPGKVLGYKPK